jgi:hypothetical protein
MSAFSIARLLTHRPDTTAAALTDAESRHKEQLAEYNRLMDGFAKEADRAHEITKEAQQVAVEAQGITRQVIAQRDELWAEVQRLSAVLSEIANSGVDDQGFRKYVEVQVDRSTWEELQAWKSR